MGTFETIREARLVAVVTAPVEDQLIAWAKAVAAGGVRLLGIPVTMDHVTELTADLADESGLCVGVVGVLTPDHLAVALAAGAEFVVMSYADAELVKAARQRGLTAIAGALTPTEIARCAMMGPDFVAATPIGSVGGAAYMRQLRIQFPALPLIAAGGIGVDDAPNYLEAGASAVVVDRGLFPSEIDPAAQEVITLRAQALAEVCAPETHIDYVEFDEPAR